MGSDKTIGLYVFFAGLLIALAIYFQPRSSRFQKFDDDGQAILDTVKGELWVIKDGKWKNFGPFK